MTPPHPAFSNLGLALQVVRHFSGQSQAKLAREAGFGKSQLSKYESGKELPKFETLGRLLKVIGMSPLAFFTVMDILDGIGQDKNKEDERNLGISRLLSGGLGEVVALEEQADIRRVFLDLLNLFESQITVRIRLTAEGMARDRDD